MVQVTFFSTSKPVVDKKTDLYPEIISNSIEKEMQNMDSDAKVNCTNNIKNDMATRGYQKKSIQTVGRRHPAVLK